MTLIPLGQTGLMVSDLCLGTMTWGTQNTQAEAHAQIGLALEHGVNFWDTAEMYPTNPISAATIGDTEVIIGNWFAHGGRDRVVLATKVTGAGMDAVRGGAPITGATLRRALEGSLRRLQTDYVDLYQLHWPNRGSYHFRKMWAYVPRFDDPAAVVDDMHEVLATAADLVAEGKVRAFGLSNESVWGAAKWLHLADQHGLPRMGSVQNEYSLLCRQFDTDWSEFSVLENMPLLAFSPLACGLLSGKYAGGTVPPGSRRAINPDLSGRVTPNMNAALQAYLDLAATHGVDPSQMAIAFCRSRPFPAIPIIGATSTAQLKVNLGAAGMVLSADLCAAIDSLNRAHPSPY